MQGPPSASQLPSQCSQLNARKLQWQRVVAQWEGLSAAPVGGKGMSPFPLRLPRTLTLGSRPRLGPGSARCTGAQHLPEIQILGCLSDAAVLPRPAGLPGVSVLSESVMAKYYQLQQVPRDADACSVVVIVAWWTKLRRTSGDLKDLDKLGIDLVTWLAGIALAPPRSIGDTGAHGSPQPTGCGCGLYLVPFPHFSQQGWLAQPSPTTLFPFDPTSYSL